MLVLKLCCNNLTLTRCKQETTNKSNASKSNFHDSYRLACNSLDE